jgi:mono/diheme cytochrome c family protein
MAAHTSFMKSIVIKVIAGLIVGGMLVGLANVFAFPPVFQMMFFLYALLGAAVFILLDAPSLGTLSGMKAILGLIVFYIVVSTIYIGGASLLPQFDPQDEMGKIDKLLKVKRERAAHEHAAMDESLQQVKALDKTVQTLTARLNQLAPLAASDAGVGAAAPMPSTGGTDLIARGKEVYELHECYNCHKIGGQGSVKKRGPVLDNIGSLLTIDDIKKKVFDTTYLYAEGFEKEHKKGLMPDKYKELMTDEELGALAAYLSTLKNPAVETPCETAGGSRWPEWMSRPSRSKRRAMRAAQRPIPKAISKSFCTCTTKIPAPRSWSRPKASRKRSWPRTTPTTKSPSVRRRWTCRSLDKDVGSL